MVFKAKTCKICGWNTVYSSFVRENSGTYRVWTRVGYFCIHCGAFEKDYTTKF